jgi:hypothetical protein
MTTRAIKKLTKRDDLKLLKAKLAEEDEELSDGVESFVPVNKFNLVICSSFFFE